MTHAELIARLEKLDGPDRLVECEIVTAFISYDEAVLHQHYGIRSYEFTGSIDAAVALVERLLPGAWYLIGKGKINAAEAMYGAQILFGSDEVLGDGESDATPAIALCIALLRALDSRP
jgi:hypothetical protein